MQSRSHSPVGMSLLYMTGVLAAVGSAAIPVLWLRSDRAESELAPLESALARKTEDFNKLNEQLAAMSSGSAQASGASDNTEAELAKLTERLAASDSKLREQESVAARAQEEAQRWSALAAESENRLKDMQGLVSRKDASLNELQSTVAQLKNEARTCASEASKTAELLAATQNDMQTLRNQLAEAQGRLGAPSGVGGTGNHGGEVIAALPGYQSNPIQFRPIEQYPVPSVSAVAPLASVPFAYRPLVAQPITPWPAGSAYPANIEIRAYPNSAVVAPCSPVMPVPVYHP